MSAALTPFPRGPVPEDVERWEDGPPYGRLLLTLEARWNGDEGAVVRDHTTGEYFRVTSYACGLGCKCAAEAEWLPGHAEETSTEG